MSLFIPLRSRYLHALLKPPPVLLSSHSYATSNDQSNETKKPLHVLFTQAVGLSPKPEHESDAEEETNELKKSLRKLEQQVRKLKENNETPVAEIERPKKGKVEKPVRLYKLFADEESRSGSIRDLEEDPSVVYRRLSPDVVMFVTYLYDEGYFRDANFVRGDKFDISCFESSYARGFIRSAAEKFGKDKQEIAKWVSASNLKKVALFGCPSLGKKNIFSAKKLRAFFKIHEPTVCSSCTLQASCKFSDQGVWKFDANNLDLAVVMRVIILYALESTHPQLVVPEEIKDAVSHLLKEILNLSQNIA